MNRFLLTPGAPPAPIASTGPSCRICGCTDHQACVDPDHGPCWWIEADLCSHCGEPLIVIGAYDRLRAGVVTPRDAARWMARARTALGRAASRDMAEFEV